MTRPHCCPLTTSLPPIANKRPRALVAAELAKGFGFFHSKPASAFSPVAVTPDELGPSWNGAKRHLPLLSHLNGELFGRPNAGADMTFDFPTLIAHAAKTRALGSGTIIGSGTVSNRDRALGSSCIAERRMIEMLDAAGVSIFGAIEQRVARGQPGR